MGLYSVSNKDNVVQCKWDCKIKHEHYLGTYENAVKYFNVAEEEIKSYGKLINIIIFHQTSDRAAVKLSNELYDLLIRAQSEHKYWAAPEERHKNAMDAIDLARKSNLIFDDKLCKKFVLSNRKNTQKRVYMYKIWCEQNDIR